MSSFSTMKIAGLVLLGLLPHLASAANEPAWGLTQAQALALEGGTILNYKGRNTEFMKSGKPIPEWKVTGKGKRTLNVQAADNANRNRIVVVTKMFKKWKKAPEEEQLFLLRTANAEALEDAKAMKERFPVGLNYAYKAVGDKTFQVKIEKYKLGMTAEAMTAQVKFLGIKPTNAQAGLPTAADSNSRVCSMDIPMSIIDQKLSTTSSGIAKSAKQCFSEANTGSQQKGELSVDTDRSDAETKEPEQDPYKVGETAFVGGRFECKVRKRRTGEFINPNEVFIKFTIKGMKPYKQKAIAKMMREHNQHIVWSAVARDMKVPVSLLKKEKTYGVSGRRLGWKPSHDIPRRCEGFHHSFVNRVLRESERQS